MRVHSESAPPLVAALILGAEVHMKVTARVAVCAVVEFVGLEDLVNSLCNAVYVGEEGVPVLVGYIHNLAYVVLICDDASAAFGLLFEEYELAYGEVADINAEFCKRFAVNAVAAIFIFHYYSPFSLRQFPKTCGLA